MGNALLRARLAGECGAEPLADWIWEQWNGNYLKIEDGNSILIFRRCMPSLDRQLLLYTADSWILTKSAGNSVGEVQSAGELVEHLLELKTRIDQILAAAQHIG